MAVALAAHEVRLGLHATLVFTRSEGEETETEASS